MYFFSFLHSLTPQLPDNSTGVSVATVPGAATAACRHEFGGELIALITGCVALRWSGSPCCFSPVLRLLGTGAGAGAGVRGRVRNSSSSFQAGGLKRGAPDQKWGGDQGEGGDQKRHHRVAYECQAHPDSAYRSSPNHTKHFGTRTRRTKP